MSMASTWMSLGRPLLRFAKGTLAKSPIKFLGTELLIGESSVLLGVDWINRLHLFKKKEKNTSVLRVTSSFKSETNPVVCKLPFGILKWYLC